MKRRVFPFSAVLGQDSIKNALIWNFVNPRIGGVLISGQKGTAKSTLVRASERISGRKIIELPLNITEDRLIGAIDFEQAVKNGVKLLNRGLLADAHQNILYVDEINLLSDNITKALLEAAADGWCHVEREGISDQYPCDFILIGSMNPEESGLRPQLLDRFGLYVDVVGEKNPLIRCEIMRRRLEFESDPACITEKFRGEDALLLRRIQTAQERLPRVEVSASAFALAAQLAQNANCQGSRGELAIIETARAICALNGSSSVNKEAIAEAAKYALPHRMREGTSLPKAEGEPQEPNQNQDNPEQDSTEQQAGQQEPAEQSTARDSEQEQTPESGEEFTPPEETGRPGDDQEKTDAVGAPFDVGKWLGDKSRARIHQGSGRRSLVKTDSMQGRYVKSTLNSRDDADLAFDATLRAAAPYQSCRNKHGLALAIEKSDIRTKVREKRTGNFIVFVVDASGSMGVGRRMMAVKGAILSLLNDAYQKRDRVAMVTFRKDGAEQVLGMTRSVDLAAKRLESLATGGKTPLYAGLELAHNLISAAKRREKDLLPVLVLVSDGRATRGRGGNPFEDAAKEARAISADHIKSIVIDVEQDFIKLKLAQKLAKEMNAQLYRIEDLHAGAIRCAVDIAVSQGGNV